MKMWKVSLAAIVMFMVSGCLTTNEVMVSTLDATILTQNYDSVKDSIKNSSKKFTKEEQATIAQAEVIFQTVYDDLMQPGVPITYAKLDAASYSLVDMYESVKEVVGRHWDDYSPREKVQLKDFEMRIERIYEQLDEARKSEDAQALKDSTGQYLEILSIIGKLALTL